MAVDTKSVKCPICGDSVLNLKVHLDRALIEYRNEREIEYRSRDGKWWEIEYRSRDGKWWVNYERPDEQRPYGI